MESEKKASKVEIAEVKEQLSEKKKTELILNNHYLKHNTSANLSPQRNSGDNLRRKSLLTSRNLITPPHSKNLE